MKDCKCVGCGKLFSMPNEFTGTILCEDCDPFMEGSEPMPNIETPEEMECSGIMFMGYSRDVACRKRATCKHYKNRHGGEYVFIHWEGYWADRCLDYKEVGR